jgi:hypothetical protein
MRFSMVSNVELALALSQFPFDEADIGSFLPFETMEPAWTSRNARVVSEKMIHQHMDSRLRTGS